jgi:hypothetical protein
LDVNTSAREVLPELGAEAIVSEAADHADRIAKASHRDRLIGTFASRMRGEVFAEKRLAGSGNSGRPRNEIEIDTANDDDRFLCAQGCLSFLFNMIRI